MAPFFMSSNKHQASNDKPRKKYDPRKGHLSHNKYFNGEVAEGKCYSLKIQSVDSEGVIG